MKRHHFLTLTLTVFFFIVAFNGIDAYAQTSISGDTLCGSTLATKCGVKDLAIIFKGIFSTIIALGLPLLVIFIMYRFVVAYYQLAQGNANAYKEAIGKVTQAILGFIIVVALFGGIFMAMLKYLGVKDFPLELLKSISSEMTITRAYAAPIAKNACPNKPQGNPCITNDDKAGFCTGSSQCSEIMTVGSQVPIGNCGGSAGTGRSCLTDDNKNGACYTNYCVELLPELPAVVQPTPTPAPTPTPTPTPVSTSTSNTAPTPTSCGTAGLPNPLGVCSLYDFILNGLKLVLKFFIYPALIAIWVWTGFNYVLAQGAPEKLMKTHKLLMWAVISTFVVFVIQGFLLALRGSVEKIVPSTSMVIPVTELVIKENIKFINKII